MRVKLTTLALTLAGLAIYADSAAAAVRKIHGG